MANGALPVDLTGHGRGEMATTAFARSPRDLLRVMALGVISLVVAAVTWWGSGTILAFEEDLVSLVAFLSPTAERVLSGLLALVGVVAIISAWVLPLVTRRFRLLGYVVLANIGSELVFGAASWGLDQSESPMLTNHLAARSGLHARSNFDLGLLAELAAILVVVGPFVGARWRRAGAIGLTVMTVVRIVVSVQLPAELFLALALGGTVGAAILVTFGRPSRRPTPHAIRVALAESALPTTGIRAAPVDSKGGTPYIADLDDGSQAFVKVLGEDERAADLLFRLYRFARLRNVGDDTPFSNLRRAVEHEALVGLFARDVGIRTPRMRGVVEVGSDSILVAHEFLDGRPLEALADHEVSDDLMRATWQQVDALRTRRIAHRDLRRANILIDGTGAPWLVGFRFSELAADQSLLDADVAQLLVTFALAAGAARTVDVAVEMLGPQAVGDALPRLQLASVSSSTQAALKAQKGLLESLQAEVTERCGVEEVVYEQLHRVSARSLLTVAVLVGATYFLLPQFANLPAIVEQVQEANWWWLPLMLVASGLTYVGATSAVMGAVPDRLPAGTTFLTEVGASFAGTLAPAGLGGMALNIRYLQKRGVDHAVAVSSIGLNTVVGVAVHVGLLIVFAVWAGRDAFDSISLPDPRWMLLAAVGFAVLGGISLAIPVSRRVIAQRLVPVAMRAITGLTEVLKRPSKLLLLLGGATGVTFCYLTGLFLAVQAFGGGLPFAAVGAAYLVGSAVATAAPTPGGIGAVEAALIATLVAAGLDQATAVPAVFLFRITTFWVPILPGWLSFNHLRRQAYI